MSVFFPEVFISPPSPTHTQVQTHTSTHAHVCTPMHMRACTCRHGQCSAHMCTHALMHRHTMHTWAGLAPAAPTEAAVTTHDTATPVSRLDTASLAPLPGCSPPARSPHSWVACKISAGLAAREAHQGGSGWRATARIPFPLGSRFCGSERD